MNSRPSATPRQMNVLAAYVAAGGSIPDAAALVGIRPSTAKRHLADLRLRSGLSTVQLIYAGAVAPVSDELWRRVEDVRRAKRRAAAPARPHGSISSVAC